MTPSVTVAGERPDLGSSGSEVCALCSCVFAQQTFAEPLLCARHAAGGWDGNAVRPAARRIPGAHVTASPP